MLYLLLLFPDLCSIIESTATRVSFWKHKSDQVPPWLQKGGKNQMTSHFIWHKNQTLYCGLWGSHLLALLPLWALTFLEIYKTYFCFPNMPNSLIPHSFCIWFLCLEHFLVDCLKAVSFSLFRSQLEYHWGRKAFPCHLFKASITSQPCSITLSCLVEFITVCIYFCEWK